MRLPSSNLPDNVRHPVRFTVVGSTGTAIQYAIYWGFLLLFNRLWGESQLLTTTAFTLGFMIEMITNYFLTTYYTFSAKPSLKNVGGFLTGRAFNYFVQIGSLNALIWLGMGDKAAGAVAIVFAGVVNFFVVRIFFKEKK